MKKIPTRLYRPLVDSMNLFLFRPQNIELIIFTIFRPADFLFARFLCPALLQTSSYCLLPTSVRLTHPVKSVFLLISKVIQKLGARTFFDSTRDPAMVSLNNFIEQNFQRVQAYFCSFSVTTFCPLIILIIGFPVFHALIQRNASLITLRFQLLWTSMKKTLSHFSMF